MSQIMVALDGLCFEDALSLTKRLKWSAFGQSIWGVKGHSLFDFCEPSKIRELGRVSRLAWDPKLKDIPSAVAERARNGAKLGIEIITVHASGGKTMLEAAVKSVSEDFSVCQIFAVTVLTSIEDKDDPRDGDDCANLLGNFVKAKVKQFASLANEAKVHGVVCSPKELVMIKSQKEFNLLRTMTPGNRMPGSSLEDQKRYATPGEASANGADLLVIGKDITEARDPVLAVGKILENIENTSKSAQPIWS